MMLKPGGASGEGDEALECYAKHTAQIEVTTHNSQLSQKTSWSFKSGKRTPGGATRGGGGWA